MTRRVVVTGMGVVTPLGNDVETFWSRLVRGESGVRGIQNFDAGRVASKVAGEVVDFDRRVPRECESALHHSFELTHISGPVVCCELSH